MKTIKLNFYDERSFDKFLQIVKETIVDKGEEVIKLEEVDNELVVNILKDLD